MNTTELIFSITTVVLLVISILLNSRVTLKALAKKSTKRAVILDSCALIDGRITELAQAGFVPETIIIPAFILKELQFLADGADAHKRERARFGLDIAKGLKDLARVEVVIDRQTFESKKQVDDKLVALALQSGAQLYTTDFNLAKVAEVEGVQVLNVNELAQRLKQNVLPGEVMSVKIIQKGSNQGQGVGYAEDGTMVVVDHADRMMGRTIDVTVDRMIGTLAGKMIFAKNNTASQKRLPQNTSKSTNRNAKTDIRTNSTANTVKQPQKRDTGFVSDLRSELQ